MKKSIIVIFPIVVLIGLVIGVNVFENFNHEDKIKGNYFRKMYGSIGMVENEDYLIRVDMFCFNSSIDFLNNIEDLSFDNDNVSIEEVSYEEQSREKDLVMYAVYFNISINDSGRYDVMSLKYQNRDNTISYPLGKLSFVCEYGNSTYVNHGCNTTIMDGKAQYTFSSKNEKAFTITDLKLTEENGAKYTYKKNVSYVQGEELPYDLNVDYSVNEGDLFVVQPIFSHQIFWCIATKS